MKRVWNVKDSLPCIDFAFEGNQYHVWHMKRWCADGELVQLSVRIPGAVNAAPFPVNMDRRTLAANKVRVARKMILAEVAEHGGLMPCI
ncbi:hypothetical protein LT875_002492 [Salmonella enterica]|nr:hypothetical protein [Salmonella enterica]